MVTDISSATEASLFVLDQTLRYSRSLYVTRILIQNVAEIDIDILDRC